MHCGQHQQPANGSESSAGYGVQSAAISDRAGRQNGQKYRIFNSQRLRTTRLDFGAEIFPKRKQIQQQNRFGMCKILNLNLHHIFLSKLLVSIFYYLTGILFAGMWSDRTQIHLRDVGPPHPEMRERIDTSGIQKRRRDGDHFAQRP